VEAKLISPPSEDVIRPELVKDCFTKS